MEREEKVKFLSGDRDLFEKYKITTFIARGNAMVYEVEGLGVLECVKEIRLASREEETTFEKEVKLLREIKLNPHPHIIEFRGHYILRDQRNSLNVHKNGYIQMERALTSLEQFVQNRSKGEQYFADAEVSSFLKSMLAAHTHLQRLSLAHRDIKPDNILLTALDPLHFKVCDIGVGTAIEGDNTKTHTLIGTVSYLSPELYEAFRHSQQVLSYNPYKSDVYSLGLVFLFFCNLRKVTNAKREVQGAIDQIRRQCKYRFRNVLGLGKVLKLMLKKEIAARPDFLTLTDKIKEMGWLELRVGAEHVPEAQSEEIRSFHEINKIQLYSQGQAALKELKVLLSNTPKEQQKALFEELRKVKHLDLRSLALDLELNGLEKQQVRIISQSIEKNLKLEELRLNLWNNNIDGEGGKNLLAAIGRLSQLKRLGLNLSTNLIDDMCLKESIGQIELCGELQSLDLNLGMNSLTIESIPALFQSIGKIKKLHTLTLNFESNRVTPACFKNVDVFLAGLPLSEFSLNVSGNKVKDAGFFQIGDMVQQLKALKSFSLVAWNTLLDDHGFSEFMKSMAGNGHLQELSLIMWNNDIGPKSLQKFGETIVKLSQLRALTLNLSNNPLTDQGIRLVCKSVIGLQALTSLTLHFQFSKSKSQAMRYVGRLLALRKLTYFNCCCNNNEIGVEGMNFLISGLRQNHTLKELELSTESCSLDDDTVVALNKVLAKLPLQRLLLNLSDNRLLDQGAIEMCKVLGTIKPLKELMIDYRKNRTSLAAVQRIKVDYPGVDIKFSEELEAI